MLSAAFVAMTAVSAHAETIGVAMSLFDDNWLTGLRYSMEDHAKTLKDVKIEMEDGQGDISKQQSQIDNFIAAGAFYGDAKKSIDLLLPLSG
jgi:inositol transport system substrate-binding protein